MRKPADLKKGDKVAIISTARKCKLEEVQDFLSLLKSWELIPIIGDSIDSEANQFAGSDAIRSNDLQIFCNDDSIRAIFCARGGYGTVRIIDTIDFTKLLQNPKWIVGYSDVTVLHSFLQEKLAIKSIHSFMAVESEKTPHEVKENLKRALFGMPIVLNFEISPYNKGTKLSGKVIGGNLSILYSINGTKAGWNPSGKIIFLEDIDEYLYHIDRMMLNLKRSGKLSGIKGLLIGAFSKMNDNKIAFGKNAYEIILDAVKEESYPVIFDFPAGHIKENHPLVLGSKINIVSFEKHILSKQSLLI